MISAPMYNQIIINIYYNYCMHEYTCNKPSYYDTIYIYTYM